MADEQPKDNQPNTEEVQANNDALEKHWEGDFKEEDLKIPYKRTEDDEDRKDSDPKSKDAKEEDKSEDNEPAPSQEDIEEPESVVTLQDPGDYQPQDYSFEIEVDGKTHKVESVEQAEKLAEDNAEKLSAKQIMQLMTKATKMELKSDRDKDDWQKQKDAYDSQVNEQTERNENVENIAKAVTYLEDKGLLLKVPDELREANWNDPEVAKNEAVAQQIELLNYFTKENNARVKAGLPPFGSIIDAFNAWKLENGDKLREQEDKRREEGEARRAASARVSGVSPANQGVYVPKGISVGRTLNFRNGADWED